MIICNIQIIKYETMGLNGLIILSDICLAVLVVKLIYTIRNQCTVLIPTTF